MVVAPHGRAPGCDGCGHWTMAQMAAGSGAGSPGVRDRWSCVPCKPSTHCSSGPISNPTCWCRARPRHLVAPETRSATPSLIRPSFTSHICDKTVPLCTPTPGGWRMKLVCQLQGGTGGKEQVAAIFLASGMAWKGRPGLSMRLDRIGRVAEGKAHDVISRLHAIPIPKAHQSSSRSSSLCIAPGPPQLCNRHLSYFHRPASGSQVITFLQSR
jgi:hypothetical protein